MRGDQEETVRVSVASGRPAPKVCVHVRLGSWSAGGSANLSVRCGASPFGQRKSCLGRSKPALALNLKGLSGYSGRMIRRLAGWSGDAIDAHLLGRAIQGGRAEHPYVVLGGSLWPICSGKQIVSPLRQVSRCNCSNFRAITTIVGQDIVKGAPTQRHGE